MSVRYRVELSQPERAELTALVSSGKHAARKLKLAQILLAADAGARDERSHGASACADARTVRGTRAAGVGGATPPFARPG